MSMNSNKVLQYLSTTSDTFLVVAFASLVALPFAVSIAAQPIVETNQQKYLNELNARNQYYLNKSNNQTALKETASNVLGVSTTPAVNPLQNLAVKFESNDAKKINY